MARRPKSEKIDVEALRAALAAAEACADEKPAAKAAMPAPTDRRQPFPGPPRCRRRRDRTGRSPTLLPRVCLLVPGPGARPCCGDTQLSKMGEDVTETLEVVPRRWTVIQTVRERFSCRACENIAQPPAPFHAVPRGWAGRSLLAMVLFDWLADVLGRIASHPAQRLAELLPWNWKPTSAALASLDAAA